MCACERVGGAILALMITYPLDIIKTRLQVQTKDTAFSTNYTSIPDAVKQIMKTEGGLKGLYAGLGAGLVGVGVQNFSYFYWYTLVRGAYFRFISSRRRNRNNNKVSELGNAVEAAVEISTVMELVLGALAGALTQTVTLPISVITTRLQTTTTTSTSTSTSSSNINEPEPPPKTSKDPHSDTSDKRRRSSPPAPPRQMTIMETARVIIDEEGLSGLWRGFKPALILTSNPAITYGLFERLKSLLLSSKKRDNSNGGTSTGIIISGGDGVGLKSWEIFLLGVLSKTAATVITYPYIMAKVRLQWRPLDHQTNQRLQYRSAWDVLYRVIYSEGWRGVYKGMHAQIVKAVLTQALLFVIKDKLAVWTYILFHK